MELLGDTRVTAPRLCDIALTHDEAEQALDIILRNIKIFWNFGIVHGDLSPYNILWWKSTPFIIDFPQSIDHRTHPDAEKFLARDLENVIRYFKGYIDIDEEKIKIAILKID